MPDEIYRFNQIPHASLPWGDWPVGPWVEEPDDVDGLDPVTGYVYAMRRNEFGSWCGYVCLPKRHPWYGIKNHDAIDVEVHGGIMFSDSWIGRDRPQEGAWWVGFDCGHAFDLSPGMRLGLGDEVYRDLAYVRAEVLSLAAQLRAVETAAR